MPASTLWSYTKTFLRVALLHWSLSQHPNVLSKKKARFGLSSCRISFLLTTALKMWVVSYLIERASGLAQRTIERTKITMDLAQKTIGSTTLYSQWNIVFNKRYDPTQKCGPAWFLFDCLFFLLYSLGVSWMVELGSYSHFACTLMQFECNPL